MKKRLTRKSNLRRARTLGFRSRMRRRGGRKIIARRRAKGRWALTP